MQSSMHKSRYMVVVILVVAYKIVSLTIKQSRLVVRQVYRQNGLNFLWPILVKSVESSGRLMNTDWKNPDKFSH